MYPNPSSNSDSKNDSIVNYLRFEFHAISNPLLELIVEFVPVLILIVVSFEWVIREEIFYPYFLSLSETVYIIDMITIICYLTGLLTIAAAIFLSFSFMNQIPETLETLWTRGVLASPRPREDLSERLVTKCRRLGTVRPLLKYLHFSRPDLPQDLTERYKEYIAELQRKLNHRIGSGSLGILFVMLILVFPLTELLDIISDIIEFSILVVAAFVMGLLTWRIIIVAWRIAHIGKAFDFVIQTQHPDQSGGLNPLGDLCSSIAVILAVPGLYLSMWIIILSSSGVGQDDVLGTWLFLAKDFLLIILILAFVGFFFPLYCLHRDMIYHSNHLRQQLDIISWKMDNNTRSLLADLSNIDSGGQGNPIHQNLDRTAQQINEKSHKSLEELSSVKSHIESEDHLNRPSGIINNDSEEMKVNDDEIERRNKEIELLHKVYDQNAPIPVWPFNRQVAFKFITSQIVPILTLTGIAPALVNVFASIVGAIPA